MPEVCVAIALLEKLFGLLLGTTNSLFKYKNQLKLKDKDI